MIHLYQMPSASPNIRKIAMMLNETDLPYTVKQLENQEDGKLADDFLVINPNATVPAIVDEENGAVIFESGAILHYLAEKSGQFLPDDLKERGEVMKWLMFEVANMGPTMGELFHYLLKTSNEISEVHLQRYREKVAQYCAILDRQLASKEFLCGTYSIADIALYPWTVILEDMAEVNINDYSNLSNWASRIAMRSAALATA